jgi:hypothetical protein
LEPFQLTDAARAEWGSWDEFNRGFGEALIRLVEKYGGLLLLAEPFLQPEGDAGEVWQSLQPQGSEFSFTGTRFGIAAVLQEIRVSAVLLRWLEQALEGEQLPDDFGELMFYLSDDLEASFLEAISPDEWVRIVGDHDDLRFEVLELLTVALLAVISRPGRPQVETLLQLCGKLLDLWSRGWPVLGVDSERRLVIGCVRS